MKAVIPFYKKRKVLWGTGIVVTLLIACLLAYFIWPEHKQENKLSFYPRAWEIPEYNAPHQLPDLNDPTQLRYKATINKGDISETQSYWEITGQYPITIKRATHKKQGATVVDYFVLRKASVSYTKPLFAMVQESKEFIGKYESQVVKKYGKNLQKTYNYISSLNTPGQSVYNFIVFHKENRNAPEKLIGSITISKEYRESSRTHISYFFGDPKHIKVAGAATPCVKASLEYFFFNAPETTEVYIATDKNNKGSQKVAEKLNATELENIRDMVVNEESSSKFFYTVRPHDMKLYKVTYKQLKQGFEEGNTSSEGEA